MSAATLKECPFCGAPANAGQAENDRHYVECTECDANVGKLMGTFIGLEGARFPTEEAAISAWNRRTQAPTGEKE